MGNDEKDQYGKNKNPQMEYYNYFIDSVLYFSRLFEGNLPNINDILDLDYSLYYDLINKQIMMKKQENQKREQEQRKRNNKRK